MLQEQLRIRLTPPPINQLQDVPSIDEEQDENTTSRSQFITIGVPFYPLADVIKVISTTSSVPLNAFATSHAAEYTFYDLCNDAHTRIR